MKTSPPPFRPTPGAAALPAAVVIALDSITGLQTARILARRGIPVLGVARNRRHPSCRTNVCERIVFADTTSDELVEVLEKEARTLGSAPVLFPCSDLSVLTVSRCRDWLRRWYRMVLPAPGVIEQLLDKALFHARAVAAGWPVAASHVLNGPEDVQAAAARLAFPCIVKPAVKTATWHARTTAKLFKAHDAEELGEIYCRCRPWTDALVAQEWIEGPDTSHFTCNAYFDANSTPIASFVSQKLRQWPLEGGVGCLSQECRNDRVLAETVRLFQGAGHHGLAYLEMKEDQRSGRLVIIEPNVGRPTGRSAAADRLGVDLIYTQYCDALGWPLPASAEQPFRGNKWIYFRQDCQAAFQQWRRGNLRFSEWVRSLRGCREDAMFALADPRPFFADFVEAWSRRNLSGAPLGGRPQEHPAKTARGSIA